MFIRLKAAWRKRKNLLLPKMYEKEIVKAFLPLQKASMAGLIKEKGTDIGRVGNEEIN